MVPPGISGAELVGDPLAALSKGANPYASSKVGGQAGGWWGWIVCGVGLCVGLVGVGWGWDRGGGGGGVVRRKVQSCWFRLRRGGRGVDCRTTIDSEVCMQKPNLARACTPLRIAQPQQ
jgi:hypothetical protein